MFMTVWRIPDAETLLWQDVNPRTGTRLDCPRPPDNKWATDVEVDYLDPQQMSPRFLPRRSRTDSTPGTVLRVSIIRLIFCNSSHVCVLGFRRIPSKASISFVISVCVSAHPRRSQRLLLNRLVKFAIGTTFMKIRKEIPSLAKIGQNYSA